MGGLEGERTRTEEEQGESGVGQRATRRNQRESAKSEKKGEIREKGLKKQRAGGMKGGYALIVVSPEGEGEAFLVAVAREGGDARQEDVQDDLSHARARSTPRSLHRSTTPRKSTLYNFTHHA